MFDLSPIKILVIVSVALLLLGPDKLPEVANKLGSTWRALKRLQEKVEAEVREAIPDLPSTSEIVRIARSPVNILNQLADRADARDAQATTPEAESLASSESPTNAPDASLAAPTASPLPAPLAVRTDYAPPPPDPSLN